MCMCEQACQDLLHTIIATTCFGSVCFTSVAVPTSINLTPKPLDFHIPTPKQSAYRPFSHVFISQAKKRHNSQSLSAKFARSRKCSKPVPLSSPFCLPKPFARRLYPALKHVTALTRPILFEASAYQCVCMFISVCMFLSQDLRITAFAALALFT